MNYFYFDQNNQKFGPVNEEQLRELATQRVIGLHTPMETDTGHKGVAGQIPGLFPATSSSPFVQTAQAVSSASSKQLFCTNCGNPVSEQAVACMSCGARPTGHKKFCRHCGTGLNPEQIICIKCGAEITGKVNAQAMGSPKLQSDDWIGRVIGSIIGSVIGAVIGLPIAILCPIKPSGIIIIVSAIIGAKIGWSVSASP